MTQDLRHLQEFSLLSNHPNLYLSLVLILATPYRMELPGSKYYLEEFQHNRKSQSEWRSLKISLSTRTQVTLDLGEGNRNLLQCS